MVVFLSIVVWLSGCAGEPKPLNQQEISSCIGSTIPLPDGPYEYKPKHRSRIYMHTRDYFSLEPGWNGWTIANQILQFPFAVPYGLLLDTITLPYQIHAENSYQSHCNQLKKEVSKENIAPPSGN